MRWHRLQKGRQPRLPTRTGWCVRLDGADADEARAGPRQANVIPTANDAAVLLTDDGEGRHCRWRAIPAASRTGADVIERARQRN